MNLLDSRVVLRLRTVPDVLDLAYVYCTKNQRTYQKLAAILLVPCLAICLVARYLLGWHWGFVWLCAVVLGGVAQGAFTLAAGQLLFSKEAPLRPLLGRYFRRLPSYLAALFITRLLIAVGALPFFLLVPSAWVRVVFVHEVSLLETASAGEAFARSGRFVKRQAGAVIGLLVCLLLSHAGFVLVVEALGKGLVEFVLQLGRPFGSLLDDGGSVYALSGFFLAIPYVASARFLKYTDIRTRKEGWDIQLRFKAIEATGEAGPRAAA